MSALDIAVVTVPVAGAAATVGALWWRGRRRRRAVAVAVEQATADAQAVEATAPDSDPVPSEPTGLLAGMPFAGTGHPAATTVPQALRVDLGQPVATLPPARAPRRATEPIPRVPVPADAPTPFAPTWKPVPADPDHWQKVEADPGDPTPEAAGLVEPTPPPWVTESFTDFINQAEFNKYRSLAEWSRLNEQQNGAGR